MEYKKAEGLRSLSSALKVVAWIVLVIGLIAGIATIVAATQAGQELAQRAPAAAQELEQRAPGAPIGGEQAVQALQATGAGVTTTGVIGGILTIVMAVVWFLILYALGGICDATADIWSSSRVTAGETATSRREVSSTEPGYRRDVGEPGYTSPPPSRAPS